MNSAVLCRILAGVLALCLILLVFWIFWFFRQWKTLDEILECFQNNSGQELSDVQETRESRLVSQLRQILNRASFRESQAVREKNEIMELISDLSHQLKTPLANIVLDMELLEQEKLTEEQRKEFLRHTKTQASKMQWLMQNLLKASRLETGIIQFQPDNTGIKDTLAKAVSSVYAQASGKNIEIRLEEFEDFTLYHNPKWTIEAVGNILENAVKYSPNNSRIEISLNRLELYTGIVIKDQGIGIPETEFQKIFQRFYRGRQVAAEEGTGLGLYLAQLILQSEQGYITVSSREGQGSSFTVFLLNHSCVF